MRAWSLIWVFLVALPASGQTVRTTVDTDTLSIGARQRLVVSIRHDGQRLAVFPDEGRVDGAGGGIIGRVGDLELLRRLTSGSRLLPDDSRLDSVLYEMTTFALDTARVAAQVGLSTEADTTLFASVVGTIPVRSIVPEDAQDIRDLGPLVEFPRALWPWILGLLLVAAAIWYFLIREQPQPEVEEDAFEEPAEPPFDEAMRRLRSLSTAQPAESGMKLYFVELSDIVRTYIARRTHVPARELTTNELLDRLERKPVLRNERVGEVQRILSVADLVKFADHHVEPAGAQDVVKQAQASIERVEKEFAPAEADPDPQEVSA